MTRHFVSFEAVTPLSYDVGVFAALASAVEELDIPASPDALRELFALTDRLRAKTAEAVGRFDRDGAYGAEGATSCVAWLRSNAGVSSAEAVRLSKVGRRVLQLPVTFDAWLDGSLSGGQVEVIAANVSEAALDLFVAQEATLVPRLVPLSLKDTFNAMQLWRQRADALLDPPEVRTRRRELSLSETLDGRGVLRGELDAAGLATVHAALDAAATHDGLAETRSPAERRADALIEVCEQFCTWNQLNPERRNRPHVELVINADDLPAHLGGVTVDDVLLDPTTVARWLCDCTLARAVLDADGVILDYGRDRRSVPPSLFRAVRRRDKRCRWPGCERKPSWCEAHHLRAWEHGGPTDISNLALFCSRHHHQLHKPGHHAKLLPDTTIEITHPDGTTQTSRPPP